MLSAIQDEIYTCQILMSLFEQLNDKVSHFLGPAQSSERCTAFDSGDRLLRILTKHRGIEGSRRNGEDLAAALSEAECICGRIVLYKLFGCDISQDLLSRNDLFDMFLNEFIAACNDTLRYPLQERSLEGARDRELSRRYSTAFMIGGLGQMLKAWTEEGFAASVEEIAGSVQFLVPSVPAE